MTKQEFKNWATRMVLYEPRAMQRFQQFIDDVKQHDPEVAKMLQASQDAEAQVIDHLKKRMG